MKNTDISTLVLRELQDGKISQRKFAVMMGVSRSTVGRLLNNDTEWTIAYLSKAGALFNKDYFVHLSTTHDRIVREKDKEIDTLIQEKIDITKKLDESERENRELRDELKVEKRFNDKIVEIYQAKWRTG
jgi:transcriptional regulator with XRE-family HTH domain